jgi:hypothetical protein
VIKDTARVARPRPVYAHERGSGQAALGFRSSDEEFADLRTRRLAGGKRGGRASRHSVLFHGRPRAVLREHPPSLAARGIPVEAGISAAELMGLPDNRRLVALLKLLADPTDSLAWWTLVEPTTGLGGTAIDSIFAEAVSSPARSAGFSPELPTFHRAPNKTGLETRRPVGRTSAILDSVGPQAPQAAAEWGVWTLEQVAGPTGSVARVRRYSLQLVRRHGRNSHRILGRLAADNELRVSASEGVRFMTMMSSKGLTARATFVVGVENGLVPGRNRTLQRSGDFFTLP